MTESESVKKAEDIDEVKQQIDELKKQLEVLINRIRECKYEAKSAREQSDQLTKVASALRARVNEPDALSAAEAHWIFETAKKKIKYWSVWLVAPTVVLLAFLGVSNWPQFVKLIAENIKPEYIADKIKPEYIVGNKDFIEKLAGNSTLIAKTSENPGLHAAVAKNPDLIKELTTDGGGLTVKLTRSVSEVLEVSPDFHGRVADSIEVGLVKSVENKLREEIHKKLSVAEKGIEEVQGKARKLDSDIAGMQGYLDAQVANFNALVKQLKEAKALKDSLVATGDTYKETLYVKYGEGSYPKRGKWSVRWFVVTNEEYTYPEVDDVVKAIRNAVAFKGFPTEFYDGTLDLAESIGNIGAGSELKVLGVKKRNKGKEIWLAVRMEENATIMLKGGLIKKERDN